MLRTAHATLFFLSSFAAFAQTQTTLPLFEVAEVKVNKSGDLGMSGNFQNGRITLRNGTMKLLITAAYHVDDNAVAGAPGWLDSDRFDVIAKAAPTTSEDDLRRMLQALLIERFKLAVHPDEKLMPVYVLVVAKGGPKLKAPDAASAGEPHCGPGQGELGNVHRACQHTSMADLAESLPDMAPGYIKIPVVDQTGLKGAFDFKLDWTGAGRINGGRGADASGAPSDPAGGLTVFDALQAQLGLKLESRKLPRPIVVIDHVERVPVEN